MSHDIPQESFNITVPKNDKTRIARVLFFSPNFKSPISHFARHSVVLMRRFRLWRRQGRTSLWLWPICLFRDLCSVRRSVGFGAVIKRANLRGFWRRHITVSVWLAFVSKTKFGDSDIYVAAAGGTDHRNVTNSRDRSETRLIWNKNYACRSKSSAEYQCLNFN